MNLFYPIFVTLTGPAIAAAVWTLFYLTAPPTPTTTMGANMGLFFLLVIVTAAGSIWGFFFAGLYVSWYGLLLNTWMGALIGLASAVVGTCIVMQRLLK